jgi:HK97 family phage portal protein
MGILQRLFGRGTETRDAEAFTYGPRIMLPEADIGLPTSARLAENLATVLACVNVVSGTLASLPPLTYHATPNGRKEISDHPVARLVKRPNAWMTWPGLCEWLLAETLLAGNGVAEIEYDRAGRPVALLPIPWRHVTPVRLPSGRIALDVCEHASPWGSSSARRRIMADDVLWLRDRTDDGIVGRSRLSRAPDVIRHARDLQAASGSIWGRGLLSRGFLSAPAFLTDPQRKQLGEYIRNFEGAQNAGRIPIFEGGFDFKATSISPEDAETLATKRFTTEDLCRLFGVPPPLAGDLSHGTFTNSREAGRWFCSFTLAPWARKLEAEFSRTVFGSGSANCSLEIDMSALLRSDPEARWQSHKIAVEAGILDRDEIREVEGWSPRPAPPQEAAS